MKKGIITILLCLVFAGLFLVVANDELVFDNSSVYQQEQTLINKQDVVSEAQSSNAVLKQEDEKAHQVSELPLTQNDSASFDFSSIPSFDGKPYIAVNNNIPYFNDSELTTKSFEKYSRLDNLSRCGVAYASIGTDIMPTGERGSIGNVKPSGWHTIKYANVDGKYLYNRCHLIGFQLSGENANESNLITGTRYMNMKGMLPFENMVADYVQETRNHVMYRVTPIFEGDNLLASGVLMEGYSVEDNGDGICFNVFCYNAQPGIKINYANGDSESEDGSAPYGSSTVVATPKQESITNSSTEVNYIANKNTKKFHYPYCGSVGQMKEKNKKYLYCSRDEVISQGYSPCGNCNP